MRSGDVLTDARTQRRLMPMSRLRPLTWAHARPGVVRTDGSGNISSIETGAPVRLEQAASTSRPSVGNVRSRPTIRVNTNKLLQWDSYRYLDQCSLVIMYWQASGGGPAVKIEDVYATRFLAFDYSLFSLLFGSISSATQSQAVSNDTPYLATIATNGSDGPFRLGGTSVTVSGGGFAGEDAMLTVALSSMASSPVDYFEIVAFDRNLNVEELQLVEGIVAWSNGLPEVLNGQHRFRTRPPLIGD